MSTVITAEAAPQVLRTQSVRPVLALGVVGLGLIVNVAWIGAVLWLPVRFLRY